MWTTENRGRYDRSKLRYPSDLTDEEWSLVGPLIPAAKRGGNKRTIDVREVVNGIMLGEAVSLGLWGYTAEVIGPEVVIECAVAEHVIGGGENGSSDGADRLLGSAPVA